MHTNQMYTPLAFCFPSQPSHLLNAKSWKQRHWDKVSLSHMEGRSVLTLQAPPHRTDLTQKPQPSSAPPAAWGWGISHCNSRGRGDSMFCKALEWFGEKCLLPVPVSGIWTHSPQGWHCLGRFKFAGESMSSRTPRVKMRCLLPV